MHKNLILIVSLIILTSCNSSKKSYVVEQEESDKLEEMEKLLSEYKKISVELDSLELLIKEEEEDCDSKLDSLKKEYLNFIKSQDINPLNLPQTLPIDTIETQGIIGFGLKTHPISRAKVFHRGIDIPCDNGRIVHSTINGKVDNVQIAETDLGNQLSITTAEGIKIAFSHLGQILVKENDTITIGQNIALIGQTGRSIAPHLHYEIFIKVQPIDPLFTVEHLISREERIRILCNKRTSLD